MDSAARRSAKGAPATALAEEPRLPAQRVSSYLPALDGLRALAVIAVLAYHADASSLPAGFLGVEVFLVISGFIITRGLLAERQERGRIDLRSFWLRRARRLLPAPCAPSDALRPCLA